MWEGESVGGIQNGQIPLAEGEAGGRRNQYRRTGPNASQYFSILFNSLHSQ